MQIVDVTLFIGLFLVAVYLLVPKPVEYYELWKKTGKSIHLSNFVASLFVLFLVFTANFLVFIRIVIKTFS